MKTRYHFLDESGDPGLDMSGSSSPYFILALVELPNRQPIPELVSIRQELNLPSRYEFKYYKSRNRLKHIFFQAIEPLPFSARAIVLDKKQAPDEFKGMGGAELMIELFIRLILQIPEGDIHDDILLIDGATPHLKRDLRIRLSEAYRLYERRRLFKKIVGLRSQGSDGLQLADMVAGAIRQYVTGEENKHFNSIGNKLKIFWQI